MKQVVMLGMLLTFMTGCSIVGPGQRGVSISFGEASKEVKGPGTYIWLPFARGMAKVDVQIQKSDVETNAASKDMQELTTHLAVNWSINPEKVVETYTSIGDEDDVYKRIISPAVSETLKAATAQLTADEILKKRTELKNIIDNQLKERLAKYGITLSDVSIVNFKFSDQFTQAIESKQVAEQRAKQAEYETLQAEAKAKAAVATAKGEAEANRMKQQTLTPQLIQYEAVQRWDGHLSQFSGSNAVPFINVTPK